MEEINKVTDGVIAKVNCQYNRFDKKKKLRKSAIHEASVYVSNDDHDGVISISDKVSGVMLSVRYDELVTMIVSVMEGMDGKL